MHMQDPDPVIAALKKLGLNDNLVEKGFLDGEVGMEAGRLNQALSDGALGAEDINEIIRALIKGEFADENLQPKGVWDEYASSSFVAFMAYKPSSDQQALLDFADRLSNPS